MLYAYYIIYKLYATKWRHLDFEYVDFVYISAATQINKSNAWNWYPNELNAFNKSSMTCLKNIIFSHMF